MLFNYPLVLDSLYCCLCVQTFSLLFFKPIPWGITYPHLEFVSKQTVWLQSHPFLFWLDTASISFTWFPFRKWSPNTEVTSFIFLPQVRQVSCYLSSASQYIISQDRQSLESDVKVDSWKEGNRMEGRLGPSSVALVRSEEASCPVAEPLSCLWHAFSRFPVLCLAWTCSLPSVLCAHDSLPNTFPIQSQSVLLVGKKASWYVVVWRRQWHPTPVLLPGKSHGWRSLVGCSPWGRWEADTTERLPLHLSLSYIGEGNGSPLRCSCLEDPGDGGAWWAAVYGVSQSQARLEWLSSSGSVLLFSHSAVSCSLWPHKLQHTRLPWPSASLLSFLKLMPTESVMLSDHRTLCHSSPLVLKLSQHQSLFQRVGFLNQVTKVVELQLQNQSFQWIFRVDFL